jgi:GrpB-like predicted nucleotidyltransferase (UPF0157 family)
MAFTGTYLAAFLLKELISEVLSHTQFAGGAESVCFDHICGLVCDFHGYFYGQIRDHLPAHHRLEFFLGGFCPQAQRIRIAKFSVDGGTGRSEWREILQAPGFSFETIGVDDGQARFRELMELSLTTRCSEHFTVFRRLWDVIRDPEIKWVTGAIQYGEFLARDFRLVGSFDVRLDQGRLMGRTFVRGTDLENARRPVGVNDLHVQYSFSNPFAADIRHFDAMRTFWEADGTRHVVDEQITVVPHNPNWSRWFEDERTTLRMAGVGEMLPIEHVGSTAVGGMPAVPCVDILIGADVPDDVRVRPINLDPQVYEYLGDRLIPGQRCYRNRGNRSFHIYVAPHGGEFWQKCIGLRDYLLANPDEARNYGAEKVAILNRGFWTLVQYQAKRANYLTQLMTRAAQRNVGENA